MQQTLLLEQTEDCKLQCLTASCKKIKCETQKIIVSKIASKYYSQCKRADDLGILRPRKSDITSVFVSSWNAGFKCPYCNRHLDIYAKAGMWEISHAASLDHIVSLRDGGTNELSNLQLICHQCNTVKNKTNPQRFNTIINAFRESGGDGAVIDYLNEQYPIAYGQSLPQTPRWGDSGKK